MGGRSGEFWGAGQRFGVVPIGGGRIYWFATANAPEGAEDPPEGRKARLQERFAGWAFQIPALIERTPEAAIIHNDLIDRPPVERWHAGRVVLLGDAAHATTPNFGQGAAMAIESGVVLARALEASEDLEAALGSYERTRRPRTAAITDQSWSMGKVGQVENRAVRAVRNFVVGHMPAGLQVRGVKTLVTYDATATPLL